MTWDYLIETAKGWMGLPFWFGAANSYIWLRNRMPRLPCWKCSESKQTKADQHKARRLPQRKTT